MNMALTTEERAEPQDNGNLLLIHSWTSLYREVDDLRELVQVSCPSQYAVGGAKN